MPAQATNGSNPTGASGLESNENCSFLFTSESVGEGHPDKMCDQISDAVLDACLEQDPMSRVACETSTGTGFVIIFGEITTNAKVDYEKVVREKIREIGFDHEDKGLNCDTCQFIFKLHSQSKEISNAVTSQKPEDVGAGDQGHMFGYACDETPELMPLTHSLTTKLGYKLTEVRRNGVMSYLRPDGKTQVTCEYVKNDDNTLTPTRVHTVVISTQHSPDVTQEQLAKDLKEHVIKTVIPEKYLDENTVYHMNPSGSFVIGGPEGDGGLTGRKIIIDTYGGWGAHGGGAFSGKDPTKVDRSAAYYARWIAKSLVAAGLTHRALVQLSYAIGVPHPLSIFVDSHGTSKLTNAQLLEVVNKNFDCRAGVLVNNLDLRKPKFAKTACYGHFGSARGEDPDFTWEVPKKLEMPEGISVENGN